MSAIVTRLCVAVDGNDGGPTCKTGFGTCRSCASGRVGYGVERVPNPRKADSKPAGARRPALRGFMCGRL